MKRLANRYWYYFRLYYTFCKFSVIDILIYRTNALIMGLAPIIWMATTLIFINTIYSQVRELGGWTYWETVFLTGVHELVFVLSWSTYHQNLRQFVDDVRTGRFDQILLRPINSRFLVSFKSLDLTAIGSFLNVIFIFFLSFGKVANQIIISRLIGFCIFLVIAYLVSYLVYFVFASLALFFINSRTFMDWIFEMTDFDRYPADIYPVTLRIFLSFFLPILFFAYFPTAFVLGKVGWEYLLYGLLVLVIFSLISRIVWHSGLRHYYSASS